MYKVKKAFFLVNIEDVEIAVDEIVIELTEVFVL